MAVGRKEKVVLFLPLNSSLGIADRIKQYDGYKTVFLILGQMIGNSIRDHGHELIILDEVAPYEDYEIGEDEEPEVEVDEEKMRREGRLKKVFPGVMKWPQVLNRYQKFYELDPVESFVQSARALDGLMVNELMANHANYTKSIESIKPDIVIIDAYYVPPCIVNFKHIPWVRLYSANPLMLTKSKLAGGVKPMPMTGFKLYDKQTRAKIQREQPELWNQMMNDWMMATKSIVGAMQVAERNLHPQNRQKQETEGHLLSHFNRLSIYPSNYVKDYLLVFKIFRVYETDIFQ